MEKIFLENLIIQNISYFGHCLTTKNINCNGFFNSYGYHIGKKHIKIFKSKTNIHSFVITGIQDNTQLRNVLNKCDFLVLSIDISLINLKLKLNFDKIRLFELGNYLKKNIQNVNIIYDNLLHSSLRIKTNHFTIMLFRTGTTIISLKHLSWLSDCYKILSFINYLLKSKE